MGEAVNPDSLDKEGLIFFLGDDAEDAGEELSCRDLFTVFDLVGCGRGLDMRSEIDKEGMRVGSGSLHVRSSNVPTLVNWTTFCF